MIIVLAALEMTTNDITSRMTKSQRSRPRFRSGVTATTATTDETHTIPLDTIVFADGVSTFRERKSTIPAVTFEDPHSQTDTLDLKRAEQGGDGADDA